VVHCKRQRLGDHLKGHWEGEEQTALEIARKLNRAQVVSLLERYASNPTQTRYEMRVELGMLDKLTAEIFALMIFLCDDLLQFKPAPLASVTSNLEAARFFAIAKQLPMELQMILCHRAVDSDIDGILSKDSEAAFKSLARTLLLPS